MRSTTRSASPPLWRAAMGTAAANGAAVVMGSVGGLVLARAMGAQDRGYFVAVTQWPAALGAVAGLGLPQAACYLISRRQGRSGVVLTTAVAAGALAGAVLAIVGLALAPVIASEPAAQRGLRLMFILSPAYIASGVLTSTLQALHIAHWNLSRLAQPALYLTGVVVLAATGRLTVSTAAAALAVSTLTQLVLVGGLAYRAVEDPLSARRDILPPLYAYGLRSWIGSVPQIMNVRLDQLVLTVTPAVLAASVGNYAVAVSLSALTLPVAVAFGSIAFPRIAAASDAADAASIERTALFGAAASAAVVSVAVAGLSSRVVPLLFGPDFVTVPGLLWLLLPGSMALAVNSVLGDVLRGRGRPSAVAAAEGTGALATVVLLWLLVPRLGVSGAAVASSAAYVVSCTILLPQIGGRSRPAPASVRVGQS